MDVSILSVDVNILGILAGVVVSTMLGFIIYSKPLAGEIWRKSVGLTEKQMESTEGMPLIFGTMFLMSAISATVLSVWVQYFREINDLSKLSGGLLGGLVAWLLPMTMLTMNYAFARKSHKLTLIDGGNILLTFLIVGVIVSFLN